MRADGHVFLRTNSVSHKSSSLCTQFVCILSTQLSQCSFGDWRMKGGSVLLTHSSSHKPPVSLGTSGASWAGCQNSIWFLKKPSMPLLFCKLIVAPQGVALGPLPVCELFPVCKGDRYRKWEEAFRNMYLAVAVLQCFIIKCWQW